MGLYSDKKNKITKTPLGVKYTAKLILNIEKNIIVRFMHEPLFQSYLSEYSSSVPDSL